jgi:predicted  nucleic acid-binding Zn-ribbon protein
MSRAESLYRLQQIDSEMDKLAKRSREIDAALVSSPAVAHARTQLDAIKKIAQRTALELKSVEMDAQSLDAKIKGEEDRLYGGKIKNPKELVEVQQEVDSMKRHRAVIEEQLLTAMMTADEARADETRCATALTEATHNWEADNVLIRKEQTELKVRFGALSEQRKALISGVARGDLDIYIALRTKKPNGVAVSLLKNGACSMCGEAPSSQAMQQARVGTTLTTCLTCGRILYGA